MAERLATVPLAAVVSSPLERCRQTAERRRRRAATSSVQTDDRLGEARYGDWTGRTIKELVKEPLWKVVQQHPSAAVFPGPGGGGAGADAGPRGRRRPGVEREARARTPSGWPAATAT